MDLVAVTDASLVASVVARVLGAFGQEQDPLPGLLVFLDGRRLLLVLDNCEHVIDAAALLAERLHREAPHVHILTTSREALRGRRRTRLPANAVGFSGREGGPYRGPKRWRRRCAVVHGTCFRKVGITWRLTDPDASTVATMCGRLDGIALAIELAASRVGAYGLQATARPAEQSIQASLAGSSKRSPATPDSDRHAGLELQSFVGP